MSEHRIIEYENGEFAVETSYFTPMVGQCWRPNLKRWKTEDEAKQYIKSITIKRIIEND